MRLKSFGCSFIFGTDLHDNDQSTLQLAAKSSNFTWPALLAKQHGWDYTCYARPGAGNLEIAERLLSQLTDVEPAIYVVGWSWIDRASHTNDSLKFGTNPWRSIMPIDTDPVAETYYKHIHSELKDKVTTLINVKVSIDALIASGNRFIMTYMDDLMFDTRWNTTPAVSYLQGYCGPYMTRFENQSFLEYSKARGFEISQTQHPLEAAHESAAELIHSYNLV
jgi:hypothetical protein